MEVLHLRCAGLDVHKKTVVASVRLAEESKVTTEVKTFATTTAGLLELSDWLSANESCGLFVRLWLLPTPPHGDAVAFGYMCHDFTSVGLSTP